MANRVYIIREASDVSQWRLVGTKLNSADYASRGLQANAFLKCKDWISGPDFLKESAEKWPNSPSDLILSAGDPEVKHGHIFVNATVKGDHNPTSTLLHHFSSWSKLKKAVAWYLKVRNVLLQLSRKRKEILTSVSVNKSHQDKQKHLVAAQMLKLQETFGAQTLSIDDVENAESAILQFCQLQGFPKEMATLQKGNRDVGKDS